MEQSNMRLISSENIEEIRNLTKELVMEYEKLQRENDILKSNGNTLALRLRQLARSVSVHPEYSNESEWGDYVTGAEKALAEWEGDNDDFKIDYKQRELERGKAAPEGAIKAIHERWRITGERIECECGLWIVPADGCPDCKKQKEDKQ